MHRWIFTAVVLALVVLRSAVFLLGRESDVDSDQAIVDLMLGAAAIWSARRDPGAVRPPRFALDLMRTPLAPGVYRCP